LAGLGAVGLGVAHRLETGIPGLVLAAIAVRDQDKARRNLSDAGGRIPIMPAEALARRCDIVVECLPPDMFRKVATSVIEAGKIFMPLSVGQLLENWDLVERAKATGARILVPTGALLGLDAVRAAAEGTIRSVTMVTRKPPDGLEGAPYLVERGISLADLKATKKIFDGSAREAFPPTSTSPRRSASPASARTRRGSKSGPIRRSRAIRTASRSTPTPRDSR
jgi:aspartate dehydrogenase